MTTSSSNPKQDGFGRLYCFKGRIGRSEYFAMLIGYVIVIWLFNAAVANSYSYGRSNNEQIFALILAALLMVAFMPIAWAVTCRRCHDIGWSGWAQLVTAIPFVNIAFLLFLLIKPGDKGSNRFGHPPDSEEEKDNETEHS